MERTDPYVVAAFYKFAPLEDPGKFQPVLKQYMIDHDIKGTVLVAPEGLNGTVSGTRENIDEVLAYLRARPGFEDLEHKESFAPTHVFERSKVRHKNEIISLDRNVDPHTCVGTYLNPREWNDLIQRDDVLLLDSRNDYEFHVGHFKGTICPDIKNFKQFPDWVEANIDPQKHQKIASFCTGGIRCEKSTSWLLEYGFEEVYHLKGGILKYLEEIPEAESLWVGDCYVFDERMSVGHGLKITGAGTHCPGCGYELTTQDRRKPEHIPGQKCAHCP